MGNFGLKRNEVRKEGRVVSYSRRN